jgi:hypothetical protein
VVLQVLRLLAAPVVPEAHLRVPEVLEVPLALVPPVVLEVPPALGARVVLEVQRPLFDLGVPMDPELLAAPEDPNKRQAPRLTARQSKASKAWPSLLPHDCVSAKIKCHAALLRPAS